LVRLGHRHRQGFFADHVLAGSECLHCLGMMQEGGRGDVHQVDIITLQHLADILDVGNPEPQCRRMGRWPVCARHAGKLHTRHLGTLLKRVEAEPTTANHAQPDFALVHQSSFPQSLPSHSIHRSSPHLPRFPIEGQFRTQDEVQCVSYRFERFAHRRKTRSIMSQAPTKTKTRRLRLGPRSAGVLLTTEEFDRARFVEGWRYELINEVLVVSPIPSLNERDPNEELGRWLRNYQESHPQGSALDATIGEQTIETKKNRRRADRVIWAGLGRLPDPNETPTIIIELVSKGKINQERDYVAKRAEYREIGVKEYWIIDRFSKTMTVCLFAADRDRDQELVFAANQTYATTLLPGYELPLRRLLELAERWGQKRKSR